MPWQVISSVFIGKWFEPRGISYWFVVIVRVKVVFRKTVVGDWRFDYLSSTLKLVSSVIPVKRIVILLERMNILFIRNKFVTTETNSFSRIRFSQVIPWRKSHSSGKEYRSCYKNCEAWASVAFLPDEQDCPQLQKFVSFNWCCWEWNFSWTEILFFSKG